MPATPYPVKNSTTELVPPFALMRATGTVDATSGALLVGKPDTDDQSPVFVNGPVSIDPDGFGVATLDPAEVVAYLPADGVPAAGETWGVKAASWQARKTYRGFVALTAGAGGFVNVARPPAPAGTDLAVEITAGPTAGLYTAKRKTTSAAGVVSDYSPTTTYTTVVNLTADALAVGDRGELIPVPDRHGYYWFLPRYVPPVAGFYAELVATSGGFWSWVKSNGVTSNPGVNGGYTAYPIQVSTAAGNQSVPGQRVFLWPDPANSTIYQFVPVYLADRTGSVGTSWSYFAGLVGVAAQAWKGNKTLVDSSFKVGYSESPSFAGQFVKTTVIDADGITLYGGAAPTARGYQSVRAAVLEANNGFSGSTLGGGYLSVGEPITYGAGLTGIPILFSVGDGTGLGFTAKRTSAPFPPTSRTGGWAVTVDGSLFVNGSPGVDVDYGTRWAAETTSIFFGGRVLGQGLSVSKFVGSAYLTTEIGHTGAIWTSPFSSFAGYGTTVGPSREFGMNLIPGGGTQGYAMATAGLGSATGFVTGLVIGPKVILGGPLFVIYSTPTGPLVSTWHEGQSGTFRGLDFKYGVMTGPVPGDMTVDGGVW